MSANDGDRFPFLLAELDWIREAIRRDVPLLGICLGAQLLAKALGAAVYRSPGKEIGWYEVELLPAAAEDRLFRDRSARETVFHCTATLLTCRPALSTSREVRSARSRHFATVRWPMACNSTWRWCRS